MSKVISGRYFYKKRLATKPTEQDSLHNQLSLGCKFTVTYNNKTRTQT